MARGRKTGGGSRKGRPNKATADVREALRRLIEGNAANLESWLKRVARKNPGKALEVVGKLAEFVVPKLARTEVSGPNGQPIAVQRHELTDERLIAIALGEGDAQTPKTH
jgi:hypothetical protein